jgi:histidinol-phosphate aminotransferase
MTDLRDLPLRDDLRDLTPYGAPQLDVPIRLNTNENPYPPPAELVADVESSLAAAVRDLNRYPDRESVALRSALAGYLGHGITTDQVWAANGSNEILQQLLMAFGGAGRSALGFVPSYAMHHLIARATATTWQSIYRKDDFSLDPDRAARDVAEVKPDIVFLCSPNNPTGTALDPGVVEAVLAQAPGMVVVDEAYAEFSHSPTLLPLLAGHPRLVVTRTMSKAFAFAGARLGYLAADPAVVDALRLVRLPYHLSALTQAAATAALRHSAATLAQVAQLRRDRDRLVEEMRAIGLTVIDSDANFVLFGTFDDQRKVWAQLLEHGILIRDVGLDGWLRVSVGTSEECDAFLAALRKVLDRE